MTPTPSPPLAPMAVPMGFAVQIKALQDAQREQAERIAALEHENTTLLAAIDSTQDLRARIAALEQHNAVLKGRRKEAVAQLLNLRTLHQEASNAFQLRTLDVQDDDLEGMLCVYGTSVTTVMNHHQRVLAHLRASPQNQVATFTPPAPVMVQPMGPTPVRYAYPAPYSPAGYCKAHNIPYPCRMCGK
ncbi:Nn.00g113200.m01.CDS01 [Neocucurbitaria sp. VM-36]